MGKEMEKESIYAEIGKIISILLFSLMVSTVWKLIFPKTVFLNCFLANVIFFCVVIILSLRIEPRK